MNEKIKAATQMSNGINKSRTNVQKKSPYRKTPAVKLLEAMADDAARTKYPTVPHLAPRKYRDDSANGLTKCIIDFLRLKGHQGERIASTGRQLNKTLTYTNVMGKAVIIGRYEWIRGTGSRGTADISATIAGKSVKIEVKIGRDKQSQHQRDYQENIEAAGGIYYIARTFQEFYEWYNQNFQS